MGNITIVYTASRRLKAGVEVGDDITLSLSATQFDRSTREDKNTVKTLSGRSKTTLMYIVDSWSVGITMTSELTQEDIDQFIYSTAGEEEFTITDLDRGNAVINVHRDGGFSRNRKASTDIGRFDYEFRVRESI